MEPDNYHVIIGLATTALLYKKGLHLSLSSESHYVRIMPNNVS